jgi:hypothetical protein
MVQGPKPSCRHHTVLTDAALKGPRDIEKKYGGAV